MLSKNSNFYLHTAGNRKLNKKMHNVFFIFSKIDENLKFYKRLIYIHKRYASRKTPTSESTKKKKCKLF